VDAQNTTPDLVADFRRGLYCTFAPHFRPEAFERMENRNIVVRGAREHNLRNVDLELPKNKLIVFTGVSGSGKSSLAFDTLYAEGQRRYVESLSNYARQFLGNLPKPDVEFIGGLAPAISIQQKTAGRNPRSTVGTVTEISDYLRVLFARLGQGHCVQCDRPITAQTREQIVGRISAFPAGTRFLILAPLVRSQKGEFKDFFAEYVKRGYIRARVDGRIVKMTDDLQLDKRIKHTIEIVIDRLSVDAQADTKLRPRVAEAVDQALSLGGGSVIVAVENEKDAKAKKKPTTENEAGTTDTLLSSKYACTHCDLSYEEPSPQLFSFNNPLGMCLSCDGIGTQFTFDPALVIPDDAKSVWDGAVPLIGAIKSMGRWRKHTYEGVAASLGIDLKLPWTKQPERHRELLLQGSGDAHIIWEWKQKGGKIWKHSGKWEGIIPQLMSTFRKMSPGPRRMQLEKYMRIVRCPACLGERLNPQARAARVAGRTLVEVGHMPIGALVPWFVDYVEGLNAIEKTIAGELVKEIQARLGFLLNVGLHYLSLDRAAPTLSGGEAQRIRLAGQIGSGLVGVLYILDEPSIGLHPRDNERLLRSLEQLRDMGNTVLVVEHDEETMLAADYLVDFGPGPGSRGGEIVAAGTPAEVLANPKSLTAQYLTGAKSIEGPKVRRKPTKAKLKIVGAKHNNLKNVTVEIPLGLFVTVTGVSGSGKSSLVNDVLKEALLAAGRQDRKRDDEEDETLHEVGTHDKIVGMDLIDKVIDIDQSAIGRTPRSNPATYIKVWDEIRILFAAMPEAKVRGYQAGRFSFNVPGGRCEACQGNGANKLEMDFLADVWVRCNICEGRRFNRETLQVVYRGKSIRDVLEMEVHEALSHFEHHPKISGMLQTLHDVGLDYIKLGQPSPTLSGGEAQRTKLAKELCRKGTGKTLYILDEPTTGLHFEDIRKLLEVLHGFVDQGNTVLVIEHNLDVIRTSDWLIDLGPDGGAGGGEITATGTPDDLAKLKDNPTGKALRDLPALKKKAKSGKLKSLERKPAGEFITHLEVTGASQHNLKNVSARIPREQMTVFSGPSGSGKTSLAMDTIYAEGQRRYVESLSSYARQFLGQVQKPRVEQITGLSPAIAIEQKTTSKSPRSTVGTITEIYDYLRILYARLGERWCPKCEMPMGTQTADQIIETILALPEGTKIYVMAPLERKGQEKYETLWDEIRRAGYIRLRVDGKSYGLDEAPAIDHRRKHNVEVVVDRNIVKPGTRTRIAEAVEQALSLGRGVIHLAYVETERPETQWKVDRFSQHLACGKCGTSYDVLNPHHYSFNSPLGWCPTCEGLGFQRGANLKLLVRDGSLSLREGAVSAWPTLEGKAPFLPFAEALAKYLGFSLDTPFDELEPSQSQVILHGLKDEVVALPGGGGFQYKGLYPAVDEASRVSFIYRMRLDHLVDEVPCSACAGSRLRTDAAATRYLSRTIGELTATPLGVVKELFRKTKLSKRDREIIGEVQREIVERLKFLVDVGLEYLSLDRRGPTLSGGEAQRIRLASQIGSGLTGVLYILDEPTIGLHPRDNARLLGALQRLRDLGNTLILVEHDREVIAAADYLLDFGPAAGDQGGEITAEGTPKFVGKAKDSLTGKYLSGRLAVPVPSNRRCPETAWNTIEPTAADVEAVSPIGRVLSVLGARQHNLRNIDVHFPLGTFIAVTGVSGSGKSSLVHEVLYNTLARKLHRAQTAGAAHDEVRGLEQIDKIISVDQDPIGNSPSSNPATYTGVLDLIRELFTRLPDSKIRGYAARRFSFNQKGGRCEACEGNGKKKIEMHFLPDVWIECETCRGSRYNPETLLVKYRGHSISDVLNLRVNAALELFGNIPKIRIVLQTLVDVGLGYMALGQPAPTMSGGEAQRVKLAAELARPSTGKTLYILDEPTTGLHFDDVRKLLDVLHRLVDLGNTVIVVEHNPDVMKSADWLIDLGPDAGVNGGFVVAQGTPEMVVAQAALPDRIHASYTGAILKSALDAGPYEERAKYDPKEARKRRLDDLELHQVGRDDKLPWEIDGPKWHTQDRVTTRGTPVKWDGAALALVMERLDAKDGFAAVNWNTRSMVEVAAAVKSQGWFLHALTGHEAYLSLVFHVGRSKFKTAALTERLGFKRLSDIPGLENYARDQRVEVKRARGIWDEVTITITTKAEVESPEFLAFLHEAIDSFLGTLDKLNTTSVEDMMPWKLNGEAWHTGPKGFPPGKSPKWDAAVLKKFLAVVAEAEPKLSIKWDMQDAIQLKLAGIGRMWARIRTKEPGALELRFTGKKGQFNLNRFEGIGREVEISRDRDDGIDVLTIQLTTTEQLKPTALKAILKEHAAGFREVFAGSGE